MQRFRRLRKNEVIRGMMQETRLHPKDFIYPIFVAEGENLWAIAQNGGVTLEALLAANPAIKNPNLIRPGDQVVIPC